MGEVTWADLPTSEISMAVVENSSKNSNNISRNIYTPYNMFILKIFFYRLDHDCLMRPNHYAGRSVNIYTVDRTSYTARPNNTVC